MFVFNLYDAAKLIAGIAILLVVLTIFSLPFQALFYVLESFVHLADNGMGYLQYVGWLLLAATIVLAVTRKWKRSAVAGSVLLLFSIFVAVSSYNMRGDVVAYGSERNEQWAAALAGEPRYTPTQWIEPEAIQKLRDEVSVSCCTSDSILEEEGSYPKDIGIAMRVGKYKLSVPGSLATSSFLTDYIEEVETGTGDWLAYLYRCVAPAQWDMSAFADKYGKGAAERVAHENNMKLAKRPDSCKTMDKVQQVYGVDLGSRIEEVILAQGGRIAALLQADGLNAACTAHKDCAQFEADFAIDIK